MERKIGEIFEFGGEWYQCVVAIQGCRECSFRTQDYCTRHSECLSEVRSDGMSVIFKKLEKVGEPYEFDGHLFQSYRTFEVPISTENYATVRELGDNSKISIEIKQNKEDMKEKKQKWGVSSDTINEINKGIEPMSTSRNIDTELSNIEEIEKNLKPFDLSLVKAGKPVCTRDGRKARIICFDRISGDDYYKIVACVTAFDGDFEEVLSYGIDGYIVDSQNPKDEDLMMLSEKKEGWVNIYKGGKLDADYIYPTKADAVENIYPPMKDQYIDTIKIEWEE